MHLSPADQKLVLTTALTFIPTESDWLKDNLAFNAKGQGCEPDSPEAVRFCARGAIRRALRLHGFTFANDVIGISRDEEDACAPLWRANPKIRSHSADGVAKWQNRATYPEVRKTFELGIASVPA